MALPHIGQSQLLSDVLSRSIATYRPGSVAVLGCSGGNGFEQISTQHVGRVVGIDINPDYVERTRARFSRRFQKLEVFAGDIQADTFSFAPVDLAYAGLLFEYVDVAKVLAGVHSMLRPGGILVAVLQRPSTETPEITPSPYVTLTTLSPILSLVPPDRLKQLAASCGFRSLSEESETAESEKLFCLLSFARPAGEHGSRETPA